MLLNPSLPQIDGGGGAYLATANGDSEESAASFADDDEDNGPTGRAAADEPSAEEEREIHDAGNNDEGIEEEQEAAWAEKLPKRKGCCFAWFTLALYLLMCQRCLLSLASHLSYRSLRSPLTCSSDASTRKPAVSLPQSLEDQEELALSILKKRKLQ